MRSFTYVMDLVHAEIDRQDMKWGADRHQHPFVWNAILTEETGEYAQAVLQTEFGGNHSGKSLEEIIQVAAVAMQIANAILLETNHSTITRVK